MFHNKTNNIARFQLRQLVVVFGDKNETPANVDKHNVPELKFGKGTVSATPLAWSIAQFVRLANNLKVGEDLDTPHVVADRYRNGIPGRVSNFGTNDSEVVLPLKTSEIMAFTLDAAKDTSCVNVMLRGKGYTVTYVEGESGHNWTSWSDRLSDAFMALWK